MSLSPSVKTLLPVRCCLTCNYFGMLEALRLEMQKIKTRKSKTLNMIAKIVQINEYYPTEHRTMQLMLRILFYFNILELESE
jgi:hypothetical protein